jgi:transposase
MPRVRAGFIVASTRDMRFMLADRAGAHVGDVFMSLIHTAELNGVEPFPYLVALQRHHEQVTSNPRDWMPWNYQGAIARLAPETVAPRN